MVTENFECVGVITSYFNVMNFVLHQICLIGLTGILSQLIIVIAKIGVFLNNCTWFPKNKLNCEILYGKLEKVGEERTD